MSSMMVGVTGLVVVMVLIMFIKIPISFSMILVGFVGIAFLTSFDTAFTVLGRQVFVTAASYNMAVIAMFILMGELAFSAGISEKAYETAHKWLGNLRGGLAMTTIAACGAFSAVSGSGAATAATIGSISLPEMKKYGYDDEFACGVIASGGVLGILIPPSVGFILFGLLTDQSIGKLYIAGILPGILLMGLFFVTAYILSTIRSQRSGLPATTTSLREKLLSLKGLIDVVVIFLVVVGGLFLGYFSPTEAGAVGSFAVLIVSIVRRTFSWKKLSVSLQRATTMVGMIILVFVGAMIFNYFLSASMLPFKVGKIISSLPLSPIFIMGAILILWIILGAIMDEIAMIILTVPILYPIILELGLDPIWFSVLGVISIEAGLISPPIGMNLYVIKGIASDVPMATIFRGVMPFFYAILVLMALVLLIPQIVLYLPSVLR